MKICARVIDLRDLESDREQEQRHVRYQRLSASLGVIVFVAISTSFSDATLQTGHSIPLGGGPSSGSSGAGSGSFVRPAR